MFSRAVRVHGKAPERRCSTPTASSGNAVRGCAQRGLSFIINQLGASGISPLGVARLAKGMTIACGARLDRGDA